MRFDGVSLDDIHVCADTWVKITEITSAYFFDADGYMRLPGTERPLVPGFCIASVIFSTDLVGPPFDRTKFWIDLDHAFCRDARREGPLMSGFHLVCADVTAYVIRLRAQWWTTKKAAQAMHVSESYVRRMARTGQVTARRHPTDSWRIWSPSTRRYRK